MLPVAGSEVEAGDRSHGGSLGRVAVTPGFLELALGDLSWLELRIRRNLRQRRQRFEAQASPSGGFGFACEAFSSIPKDFDLSHLLQCFIKFAYEFDRFVVESMFLFDAYVFHWKCMRSSAIVPRVGVPGRATVGSAER